MYLTVITVNNILSLGNPNHVVQVSDLKQASYMKRRILTEKVEQGVKGNGGKGIQSIGRC